MVAPPVEDLLSSEAERALRRLMAALSPVPFAVTLYLTPTASEAADLHERAKNALDGSDQLLTIFAKHSAQFQNVPQHFRMTYPAQRLCRPIGVLDLSAIVTPMGEVMQTALGLWPTTRQVVSDHAAAGIALAIAGRFEQLSESLDVQTVLSQEAIDDLLALVGSRATDADDLVRSVKRFLLLHEPGFEQVVGSGARRRAALEGLLDIAATWVMDE